MTREIRAYKLFWKTLEPLRGSAHYSRVRKKLADFIQRKAVEEGALSGQDRRMTGPLSGTWHFALSRNPDLILFYEKTPTSICLLMVGSHHDYGDKKSGKKSRLRTANRIDNARELGLQDNPEWTRVSWRRFSDILENPDIKGLTPEALVSLIAEVDIELATGDRYYQENGHLPDHTETELEAFIETGDAAMDALQDVLENVRRFTARDVLESNITEPLQPVGP